MKFGDGSKRDLPEGTSALPEDRCVIASCILDNARAKVVSIQVMGSFVFMYW